MEAHVCRICLRFTASSRFVTSFASPIKDQAPIGFLLWTYGPIQAIFLLAKRQDFLVVFQQYKRFSCGFFLPDRGALCRDYLFFFRLVCVFIRIFKQSQLVFQFQNTHADSSIRSSKSYPLLQDGTGFRSKYRSSYQCQRLPRLSGQLPPRGLRNSRGNISSIAAQSEIRTPSNPISSRRMPRISLFPVAGTPFTVLKEVITIAALHRCRLCRDDR